MGKVLAEHFYDAYRLLKESSCLNTFLLINGFRPSLSGSRFYCYGERSKRGISELDIKMARLPIMRRWRKRRASQSDCLRTVEGEMRISGTDRIRPALLPAGAGSIAFCLRFSRRWNGTRSRWLFWLPGQEVDLTIRGLFGKIWRNITISLGHDAVSGCSTDEVMDDIKSYFNPCAPVFLTDQRGGDGGADGTGRVWPGSMG